MVCITTRSKDMPRQLKTSMPFTALLLAAASLVIPQGARAAWVNPICQMHENTKFCHISTPVEFSGPTGNGGSVNVELAESADKYFAVVYVVDKGDYAPRTESIAKTEGRIDFVFDDGKTYS